MKRNNITKGLSILFFTVSILDIIGVAFGNLLLEAIFKPMIIISLMILYYYSSEKKNNWFLLALAFSFLGDVLLLDKEGLFLFGIAAFLMTQLIYIGLILKRINKTTVQQNVLAVLPFLVYITFLIMLLKDNLGEYLIPVIVYALTIAIFGIVSLLNYLKYKTRSAQLLLIGAVLFIVSDSMIALNKFYEPRDFYPVAIMVTYVLAQLIIMRSMVVYESEDDKPVG